MAGHPTDCQRKATAVLFIMIFLYDFFLLSISNDAEATDFDDLGKMLLGGFLLAIGVAVLLVFVKLRLRDKNPQKDEFLSISNDFDQK